MNPLKHKLANEWMRQDDASPEEALDTWNTMEAEFKVNRAMAQAPIAEDLEPGSLRDEMLKGFDPSQETHEEYLQRINLDRPFNAAHGGFAGQLVRNTADGSRPGYSGPGRRGVDPETVMGVDNPNYRFLNKKQKNIARTLYKDEIKESGSVEKWAADPKNKHKKSSIVLERTTLESKPTGIIVDDPDRIIVKAKRGSNIVTDVVFPDKKMPSGKTMKEQFIIDLKERFKTPRGQGDFQNIDLAKKYPISNRQVQRAVNYYAPKHKLKYPKGKTSIESQSYQARKKRVGPVTDITVEETISKKIKRPILVEKGMIRKSGTVEKGVIDFAHRISKDHARELGIQFGTENTGFDSRLINQIIVKPSEIRLDKFYKTQRNILDKIKTGGLTKELTEEMNTINSLINKEVKKTSGRLIGVNIDPNTLETSFTGQKKKFKLSNLDKTFKELKEVPVKERNKILTKEIEKAVGAEIKRGFRPHDFKEILGDPKNRQTLLRYAKKNAPDIFSKFKNILNNPMSKRRFALYSKLPAVAIPAGIVMSIAGGKEAEAAGTGVVDKAKSWPVEHPWLTGGAAVGATASVKAGRKLLGKIVGGAFGPTGIALSYPAFGMLGEDFKTDLSKPLDRAVVGGEALLAPTLVKGTEAVTKGIKNPALRKLSERALNLGMKLPTAMKVARIASPIGLLSLAGEGIYHAGKKEMARRAKLSPQELADFHLERQSRGWAGKKGIMGLKKKKW